MRVPQGLATRERLAQRLPAALRHRRQQGIAQRHRRGVESNGEALEHCATSTWSAQRAAGAEAESVISTTFAPRSRNTRSALAAATE